MKEIQRQIYIGLIWICCALWLAGCGAGEVVDGGGETETVPETAERTAAETEQAAETETAPETMGNAEFDSMTFEQRRCTRMKEDEDAVYLFGDGCIYKLDKEPRKISLLWAGDGFKPNVDMLYGRGMILGEKLYFLESGMLSVVNKDGSGYQRGVAALADGNAIEDMYYSGGVLYLYSVDIANRLCYAVESDGTLGDALAPEDTLFRYGPQGDGTYSRVRLSSGGRVGYLSEAESIDRYGFLLLERDSGLVRIDIESGQETQLDSKGGLTDAGVLRWYGGSEGERLGIYDPATDEERFLNVVMPDDVKYYYYDGMVYLIAREETSDNYYEYYVSSIDVTDGKYRNLFDLSEKAGYAEYFSPMDFGVVVLGDYLYYTDMRDYNMYLMRRHLENIEKEEKLGLLYNTGISKIGEIQRFYEYALGDDCYCYICISYLTVDERFAGAERINELLYQNEVESCINDGYPVKGMGRYMRSTAVYNVRRFDGKYISFLQKGNTDSGGAHGMPVLNGYVFDLESGARLTLHDITGNTEQELKDIVSAQFGELFDQYHPVNGRYWGDAKDRVRESISFDSTDFVLTDDGICFFYLPYELDCYTAGTQTFTVPYEKFQMTVDVMAEW